MRKYINKLLSPLGYELKRVDRFAIFLDRLLGAANGVKFVQVGANDGVRFDGLYSVVTAHRCEGLVIEPLPDMFERLQFNYKGYPVAAVNKAVHASEEKINIYRASMLKADQLPDWVSGIASFSRDHLVLHGVPENAIVAESVRCAPLMQLLTEHGFLDANLLQVDTEGYDGEVIAMIDFTRFRPQLIKYEHKNLTMATRRSTSELLRRQGYLVYPQSEDTIAWLQLNVDRSPTRSA